MSQTRPNVLFVMVDQWPGHLLGLAGHPVIETPTLDWLARLGTVYPKAYSECPICIPARRTVMTGTSPRRHGDRVFQPAATMPELPTLAQTFRDAGYQATAVGKLHVFPQRDRIGFDEALIAEEGRPQLGAVDDYDLFLADRGHGGGQFLHAMSNNDYVWRPWHLAEDCHVTNWITRTMARTIKRKDPTRPAFWHLSYTHPHPPLVPLASYLERYRGREIDPPVASDWSADFEALPYALKTVRGFWPELDEARLADVRRAFYALCTHIDHQLRVVIGTLREENLLDDTVILVTGDHGGMLGDHGLYAKRLFYEGSAGVPMILVGAAGDTRVPAGRRDPRLVGLGDVMPTLLDLAEVPLPETCEGLSMVGEETHEIFYGEALEGAKAMRMVTDGRHKLIWYPAGNRVQLFDLAGDPREQSDLAEDSSASEVRQRLEAALIERLYGEDLGWVEGGRLVGMAAPDFTPSADRGLAGQRGLHYPQPPLGQPGRVVGTP
jgi:arylsulfatase A-like enzyme